MKKNMVLLICIVLLEISILSYLEYIHMHNIKNTYELRNMYKEINHNIKLKTHGETDLALGKEEKMYLQNHEGNLEYVKTNFKNQKKDYIKKINHKKTNHKKNIEQLKEESVMREEYKICKKAGKKTNKNIKGKEKVFKMDAEIIVKSLTSKEIRDIFKLGRTFNVREFIQIKDYLFERDREKALLKGINFLQKSLTEKEYEEAKRIADRFIHVDVAEKLAKDMRRLN